MRLVIDIPDDEYKHIKNDNVYYLEDGEDLYNIVNNGIPLNDVLNKIKEELEERYSDCDICDYDDNITFEYVSVGNILDILAIIDKYKGK